MSGEVVNCCRLCSRCLLNSNGKLENCRALFTANNKGPGLSERFKDLGINLIDHQLLSPRICKPCHRELENVEASMKIIDKWKSLPYVVGCGKENTGKRMRDTPERVTPTEKKDAAKPIKPNEKTAIQRKHYRGKKRSI